MMPLPVAPRAWSIACGLTSLTTRGTSRSMRHALELSMTSTPASAKRGACTFDIVAPAEKIAMSSPVGSAVLASSTVICSPRNGSVVPALRALAKNRISLIGTSRSSSRARTTAPTWPVAPTTPTRMPELLFMKHDLNRSRLGPRSRMNQCPCATRERRRYSERMQTPGAATRTYGRPGSRASRIVARVVVAALLIGLPCEITFAQAFGEPYPALFQPRFEGGPATDNVATASSLTITVEFRSGPSEQISRDQLMSSIDPGLAGFVFKSMFGTQESAGSAGTAAWLGPRLSQL